MPIRWTNQIEVTKKKELEDLYCKQNLSLAEIACRLNISQSSVFARFERLGIKTNPKQKLSYLNKKQVIIPKFSPDLAEFMGIMLGDGNISANQVRVTLGNKEKGYSIYVIDLFSRLFGAPLKRSRNDDGYAILYLGSVDILKFFRGMGLVNNKVKDQVAVPGWILKSNIFKQRFLQGFFDTDGSIYRMGLGWQISYCNRSLKLLNDTREALISLGFGPSRISGFNLYLTSKKDLLQFKDLIGSHNPSKQGRLNLIGGVLKQPTRADCKSAGHRPT